MFSLFFLYLHFSTSFTWTTISLGKGNGLISRTEHIKTALGSKNVCGAQLAGGVINYPTPIAMHLSSVWPIRLCFPNILFPEEVIISSEQQSSTSADRECCLRVDDKSGKVEIFY